MIVLAFIESHLESFIILTILLFLIIFYGFFFKKISLKILKTKNTFDDAFLFALKKPLFFFLVFLFVKDISFEIFAYQLKTQVLHISLLGLLLWLVINLINKIEANIIKETNSHHLDNIRFITKIIRVVVIVIFIMTVIQVFGYSISAILTIGGVGGIVIGMAAKDLLANAFSGLMLQIDKPFNTGDWIRIREHNIEGVVEKIGWRMTRIRTFSKNPVYVPNNIFSALPIETPSRMLGRRIKETIGVRYDDMHKVRDIINQVKIMLKQREDIDQNKVTMVNLNHFGAYSVDFFVYVFTKTTNWSEFHQIKEDILLKIADIIKENGAEIAFPTTQINYTP
ncbi:Small-conductance mechanosensitive channel [hydrothermal vent metagenome]|uniref:Small-conductance mechanosensitive channel n=1 Tax=hydrothermal vent metagenome TaxID=652676 RepID=A0A1W1CML8_9ZZZZ